MSVIYTKRNVAVICHKRYLDNLYRQTGDNNITYYCNHKFFSIHSPFKRKGKRRNDESSTLTAEHVKKALKDIDMPFKGLNQDGIIVSNSKAFADMYYLESSKRTFSNFHGGNTTQSNIIANYMGEQYLIPSNCKFYNYDVFRIEEFLGGNSYDLILLDPPWWNKFIRRKKTVGSSHCYEMMWSSDLSKLPVGKTLAAEGLIVVWCTNSESHLLALRNEIFPAWDVEYITTWYWVKVTTNGEPVTPFSPSNGKQPFEKLIFAARNPGLRSVPLPEEGKVLVSVPSAIHSHKPPISEVMKPYIPENPKCLEMFARYLLPNWTSFGNEVLKLQHISFFTEMSPNFQENSVVTVKLK